MHVYIVAVGDRMPAWVDAGFKDYVKRLPPVLRLRLIEVRAGRRTKGADIARLIDAEAERLVAATPAGAHVIALERSGRRVSTAEFSGALATHMRRGTDIAFWIGGPEGLPAQCLARASEQWSLSLLTFAHPVVRVVLAEQLYRAWSITQNLPYHR